jgi:Tol biopolymer transport system component
VEFPVWLPDGRGLLGLARGQNSNFNQTQIAYVSYPQGKLLPVTRDTNTSSNLSVAADGLSLVTVLREERYNLLAMPVSGPGSAARVITSAQAFTNFTWTQDGQLVGDQGSLLNRIDPATGSKTPIATEEGKPTGDPYACSDGRSLIFELGFHGGTSDVNLWRIDSSGGNLKQLTTGKSDGHAVCSSDSRMVYYIEQRDEGTLARVPLDGGTPQPISDLPISDSQFDLSPDAKLAAFATLQHSGEHKEMLALVDTETKSARMLNFERPRFGLLRFARDGKAVVYPVRENGVDNLWLQPLDGSKGKQLTDFTAEHIYDFHWSFDGKQIAMVRGHTDADVVMIREKR